MTLQQIREIVFPYGNRWFYWVSLAWFMAIAIFLISLPAMLYATANSFEESGYTVDYQNWLIEFSGDMYNLAFFLWQALAVFLMVSAASDIFYRYEHCIRGWL